MKTKRSMKARTCHGCKTEISKGNQYGQRTISLGRQASWTAVDRPTEEIPDWAWSDYRVKVDMCVGCLGEQSC